VTDLAGGGEYDRDRDRRVWNRPLDGCHRSQDLERDLPLGRPLLEALLAEDGECCLEGPFCLARREASLPGGAMGDGLRALIDLGAEGADLGGIWASGRSLS
jgi:hypothetical protein